MRQTSTILIGALAIGLVAGLALRENSAPQAVAAEEIGWTPRNTIKHETLMTAEQLDSQQPAYAAPRPSSARSPTQSIRPSWSYRNCREARAAGAAPLYRGQPGYGPHMDGDGDGIACEPYRGR